MFQKCAPKSNDLEFKENGNPLDKVSIKIYPPNNRIIVSTNLKYIVKLG